VDTARVAVSGRLCGAPRAAVEAWLGGAAAARLLLRQVIAGQIAEAPRTAGPAVCRVASWLLAAPDGDGVAQLPRHTVARLLGLVPETLSRALAELAGSGAIDVRRRSITIKQRDALAALARSGVTAAGEAALEDAAR
jgi:CRP-like cAMP-binding protein